MTFIRHGETDANREKIVQGQLDSPLNDTGRRQCGLLGTRIAGWLNPPTAVYASTLSRATESAAIIAESLGLTPRLHPGLMEMSFGELDGRGRAAIELSHGRHFLSDIFKDRHCAAVVAGGESPRQVLDRFTATVAELRREHPGPDAHIAVVSHGLALRNYFHELLGVPAGTPRFRLGNTAITQVTFSGENCYFAAIGDTAHLE